MLLNIRPAPASSTIVSATCTATIARPVIITRRDADTVRPPSFNTSCTFVTTSASAGPIPNSSAVPMEMAAATASTPKSSCVSVRRGTPAPMTAMTVLTSHNDSNTPPMPPSTA